MSKKLLLGGAAGITLMLGGCSLIPVDDDAPAPITITPAIKAELEEGCTFYTNALKFTDIEHFSGTVTTSHEDMVFGAYSEVIGNVYKKEFYDPITGELDLTPITFVNPDAKAEKEKIQSITIGEHSFAIEPKPPIVTLMASYEDHCSYLQETVVNLADATDVSIFRLYEYAMDGVLKASRDPHTRWLVQEQYKEMMTEVSGKFGGLGISVLMQDGLIKVGATPEEETPAKKSGVMKDDLITHLNGETILGKTLADAVEIMRGEPGTDIVLTIKRGDDAPFPMTLTRAIVKMKAATGKLIGSEGDIAHIKIKTFGSNNVTQEVVDSLDKLINETSKNEKGVDYVILDVRNNTGGMLKQATGIADLFLQAKKGENNIIVAVGKTVKNSNKTFMDKVVNLQYSGAKVIVLQNGVSASASEILAGAMKDSGHEVIGTRSWGKGSVQTVIPFTKNGKPARSQKDVIGALKETTKIFIPGNSELSNQGSGIIPNTKVIRNDILDKLIENSPREATLGRALEIAPELTREGTLPERICSLKKEFSGILSDELQKTVPEELIMTVMLKNEKTNKLEPVKMFDAILACAFNSIEGHSDYVDTGEYIAPTEKAQTPAPSLLPIPK